MRIGVVNAFPAAVETLIRILAQAPEHRLVWVARSGPEALACCARERPDLVLLDLMTPQMEGVEVTRRIMSETPCPILIVTARVENATGPVFEALGAGALDAIDIPDPSSRGVSALLYRIATIGKIIRTPAQVPKRGNRSTNPGSLPWLFALGASAGGPAAVAAVLKEFPAGTPAAFVAVSHLDQHFASGLADWLGKQIALPVKLAKKGDRPLPGTVLIPNREDHLVLEPDGTLSYTHTPKTCVYRPSIDVFFDSIVAHWRGQAAGVLLTGMGRDGARGLGAMRKAGFPTLAQDQATSSVYGMPKAAAQLDAADHILPLSQIGPALQQLLFNPILP